MPKSHFPTIHVSIGHQNLKAAFKHIFIPTFYNFLPTCAKCPTHHNTLHLLSQHRKAGSLLCNILLFSFTSTTLSTSTRQAVTFLVCDIPSQLQAFPLRLQHDGERNLGKPHQMLPALVLCENTRHK